MRSKITARGQTAEPDATLHKSGSDRPVFGVKAHWRRWILHVVVPLALGAAIYVLSRPSDIRFVAFLFGNPPPDWLEWLRQAPITDTIKNYPVVVWNLPDMLWAYASMAFFLLLWAKGSVENARFWLMIGLAIVGSSEALQYFGLIDGTYDPRDVIAIITGSGLAFLVLFQRTKWR